MVSYALVAYSFVVAALVAAAATPLVARLAKGWGLLDHPGPRSSHRDPTPRAGGIAVVLGMAVVLVPLLPFRRPHPDAEAFVGGGLLIAAVGLLDDRFGVMPLLRLGVHVAVAFLMVGVVGGFDHLPLPAPLDLPLGPLGRPVAMLWIVAVLNFYNFMDGLDGLAATQAVITGLALALTGVDPLCVILASSVAGGCAGFLPFNWAPARIFLGDVGSGLVGYTLATIPFLAPPETRERVVLLVGTSLWLFLADATTCLLRRVVWEKRWFEPHRQHLYQRWAIAGASHARVTSWLAAGSAVTSAGALLAWRTGAVAVEWAALGLGTALFLLEWRIVRRLEVQNREAA